MAQQHVKPTAQAYAPPAPEALTACLNCGAELTGPYCARCGQRRPVTDVTLGELLHATAQELTQWDGKVPATLRTLFTKPGLLTVDFLEGRRARWLPPLRVYFICSLAYFLSGPVVESITHRSAREVAKVTIRNPDGSTTLSPEARAELEATLPGRVFGRERIERAFSNPQKLNSAFERAFPKAMFVLLPLFALFTRLAWRRKVPQYPAHLYSALHLHAAWFGALTLASVVIPFLESQIAIAIVGLLGQAFVVWYGVSSLRRIFGDSWRRTIAKSVAVGIAYVACLAGVSFLLLAYVVWTL